MSESEKTMREIRRSLFSVNKRPIEWIVGSDIFHDLLDECNVKSHTEDFTFEGVPLKLSESPIEKLICVVTEKV